MTTQESAIKKTYDKRFAIPLDFDFFRHLCIHMVLKKIWLLGLNYILQKRQLLCAGDTSATYKLSGISLEYHVIFDEPYAMSIGEMYTRTMPIPYTSITSTHYQALSKKDTTWKIDVNNLSVRSLQGLLLLFLDKCDDFANKNKEFYNQ